MGAVYEAEHRETGRRVALKVLGHTLDSAEMRQRFVREGQLAAAVRHPNVVAVFGAEEIEGVPVIAMEMVADGTLKIASSALVRCRLPRPSTPSCR
jgi:serine/threonine protein kinase